MGRRVSLPPLHQLFELGLCHIPNVLQQDQVHQVYNAIVHTSAEHTHRMHACTPLHAAQPGRASRLSPNS